MTENKECGGMCMEGAGKLPVIPSSHAARPHSSPGAARAQVDFGVNHIAHAELVDSLLPALLVRGFPPVSPATLKHVIDIAPQCSSALECVLQMCSDGAGAVFFGLQGQPSPRAQICPNGLLRRVFRPEQVASEQRGTRSRVVLVASTAAWWTPQAELDSCLNAHKADAAGAFAARQGAPWDTYSVSKVWARTRSTNPVLFCARYFRAFAQLRAPCPLGDSWIFRQTSFPLHATPRPLSPFSQRANALYARSLGARNQAVCAASVHPGVAASGLQRHMGAVGSVLGAGLSVLGFTADR